jgi:predicted ATP-dependent endonuclease of OLD family
VVDEILRAAVEDSRTQIIVTTHSPYLLDLLPLESLVLVARKPGEPPEFWRPADSKTVREWAQDFAPGRLYTLGKFDRRDP